MTLAVTKGAILGGQILPVLKTGAAMPSLRTVSRGVERVHPQVEFPVEPYEKSRVLTGPFPGVVRLLGSCSKALEKWSFRFGVARTVLL